MFSIQTLTFTTLLAGVSFAQDCVLKVPTNPLTVAGLQSPYEVTGCDQRQADQTSFVECAIYDGNGGITIYHPLVINSGDQVNNDFIKPVAATIPQGATTACWFGTNGNSLTLTGDSAGCVNGLGKSIFGQFATCNGEKFMQTTIADAQAGKLQVPPLGSGIGGQCPSTRDFRIVDQDQSDNIVTTYLLSGKILSQNTPQAGGASKNATVLSNGSDNGLLVVFIDPVIGCHPWMVDSPTAPSGKTPALALNELQANFDPPAGAPAAIVPLNDPMVTIGNMPSLEKTNLYRAAVGQPLAKTAADASGTDYCKNFMASGIWIQGNKALFTGKTSPAPDVAVDLYTFLAQRFGTSLNNDNLGCLALFNLQQPVTLTMDNNMVVTAANINTASLQQILSGNAPTASNVSMVNPTSTPNSASPPGATVTSRRTRITRHWTSRPASLSLPNSVVGPAATSSQFRASISQNPSLASPKSSTLSKTAVSTAVGFATTLSTAVAPINSVSGGGATPTTIQPACSFTKDARGLIFDGQQWYFPVPTEFSSLFGNM